MTFLCIATYFKGADFLRGCKAAGNTVYLLTDEKLKDSPWPHDHINETFYLASIKNDAQSHADMEKGMAWLLRDRKIDRIVALDDFDVEKAALLRESFRIDGMGQTTARHFRDKLAMRVRARDRGVRSPKFSALFNNEEINHFADTTPTPWVVKPRSEASAAGIKKVHSRDELWRVIDQLGDDRHNFLVEQFKPGDVFHVDAVSFGGKIQFISTSQYLNTPFEVAHGGGIFQSAVCTHNGKDDKTLRKVTAEVMDAFGMMHSASHTEWIRAHDDGEFYFLETSSRVGGAHIAEMVEAARGVNLWTEWAKLETAQLKGEKYTAPKGRKDYAGVIISLAKQQHPDMSGWTEEALVWRINKEFHVGGIVRAEKRERVLELLGSYAERIRDHYHASAPAPDSLL